MLDIIGRTALDLANLIGKSAPTIAGFLTSPLSTIASGLLASVFGGNASDITSLYEKIANDPEMEFKLKSLEAQHETALKKIEAQNYQTSVDDRKSAREREVNIKDHVPTILAIGFLINYAAIQFYCVMHPASEIDIISARFQDVLIMIMSYYFGSAFKMQSKI